MKRVIVIISILYFGISTVQGQKYYEPELSLGVKAGVNLSMIDFVPSIFEERVTGYNGGFVFKYIREKYVGIQVELNYSKDGWYENLGYVEPGASYQRDLSYVELPFLTHLFIGKKNRLFLNIGPNFRYLIDEKESFNTSMPLDHHGQEIYNSFDFSIIAGLGGSRQFEFGTLSLEVRYNIGMTSIFERDFEQFENSRSSIISINLGYFFME